MAAGWWAFLGAVFILAGGALLVDMYRNPTYPDRPLIHDDLTAFGAALGAVSLVAGTLAVAAALPGIDTQARRLFGVVLGAAFAAGLLWGFSAALRRAGRLLARTADDLDPYPETRWTPEGLAERLVTVILGFWIGATVISMLCLAVAIFTIGQLDDLWNRDYSQIDRVFELWTLYDGLVGRLIFVLGVPLSALAVLPVRRAGPVGYVVVPVLLAIWGVLALTWVGWLDLSKLAPWSAG